MSLLNKDSIFEDGSQYVQWKSDAIRPLYDRVLVKDLPGDEKIGSIFLPDAARNGAKLRWGIVVAIGDGDKWIEKGWREQDQEPRRAMLTKECPTCDGTRMMAVYGFDGPDDAPCSTCEGEGRVAARGEMDVALGDKVLYDRRKECEIYIDGVRHSLIHQEQSIVGIYDAQH